MQTIRPKSKNDKRVTDPAWLIKNSKGVFLSLFAMHALFIVLFFDSKVHVGGDDSDYVIASVDFLNGDTFPSWHGIFYPIFISPVIAVVGLNVVVLKVISVLLSLGSFLLTYKAFKGTVPDAILFFALSIVASSYTYVFYASTTYSEPLFILIQSMVFLLLFKLVDRVNNQHPKQALYIFALSLAIFLLSITRNVGYGALITVIVFYITEKRYRIAALVSILFFLLSWAFETLQVGFLGRYPNGYGRSTKQNCLQEFL